MVTYTNKSRANSEEMIVIGQIDVFTDIGTDAEQLKNFATVETKPIVERKVLVWRLKSISDS